MSLCPKINRPQYNDGNNFIFAMQQHNNLYRHSKHWIKLLIENIS